MTKLALGLVAVGALVAATAVPALAQVDVYVGPGGFSVGTPGYYGSPYRGYYAYRPVIVITPDGTDTITAITVSTNGMRTESGYREPEESRHIGGLFFFVLAAASALFPRRGPERGPPTNSKSDHAPLGGRLRQAHRSGRHLIGGWYA